jgi:hypothetical protein
MDYPLGTVSHLKTRQMGVRPSAKWGYDEDSKPPEQYQMKQTQCLQETDKQKALVVSYFPYAMRLNTQK